MNQRKRITLQTDVNATCAIRHTLALSVLGLGFFLRVFFVGFKAIWPSGRLPGGCLAGCSILGPFWGSFWGPFLTFPESQAESCPSKSKEEKRREE